MRHRQLWRGGMVCVALALAVSIANSEDKKGTGKDAEKPSAKAAKESTGKSRTKTASKEGRKRLPRYYGKLGLSDGQREKIYSIQAKHESEIDKLEKQLADAKAKQDSECRKVLNADQKKQLSEAVKAGKAKAAKADADEMEE
jgi:hypothetical protein